MKRVTHKGGQPMDGILRPQLLALAMLLSGGAPLKAQELVHNFGEERAATTVLNFLKIGVGARAEGMGQAFAGVANDATALYWNPAGLSLLEGNQVAMNHLEWPAEISYTWLGGVRQLSPTLHVGLAYGHLSTEAMPVTTEEHPDGDGRERYVLCRSSARGAKERAMLERQMTALTEQMMKIDWALQRRAPRDLGKIERRIGRWQGKYPAAARLLQVALRKDTRGRVCGLQLTCPVRESGHPLLAKGAYLLRTNCTETDPAKLWRWYIQLTQAEAAFRTVKSDLGLRPIYHHKTERVEAHLLICFLSLALWRSLEMWMQAKSLGSSARKVVTAFSTIRSMDVTVPVKRAERVLTLRLRTVAKPDPDVALLLAHLGLHLPKGSKLVQNVVEKNT